MRVALNGWFFIRHPHTGTGQYLRALLDWLPQVSAEADYHLVIPRVSKTPAVPAGWRLHPIACGASDLDKLYFEQVLFPQACRRLRVDVAHVPYWAPPLFFSAAPLVVTIHDLIPRLLPPYRGGALARAYTALVSAATPRASLILADSEASRRDIIDNLRLPEKKVRRIYLAADQRYRPDGNLATEHACRWKYGLPMKYGLYLGGFDVRKNVPALLEAWAKNHLARHSPLVLAGFVPKPDRRLFADYADLTARLGLTSAVKFIGPVDEADKPTLYRGAAVFVYPSRYEGFGLPPLEAMSCGTPVITTRCASLPEVVGQAAIMVSPDDPSALGQAILACLIEPGTAHALRERGLEQARQFTWQKTARDTAKAYAAAVAVARRI